MAKRILKFAEKTRVLEWMKNNADRVKTLSASKAAEVCSGEIGLDVTGNNLNGIARECELPYFTRVAVVGVRNAGSWHNVAASLARAIQDLHTKLGTESSEAANLQTIIHRYHNKVEAK